MRRAFSVPTARQGPRLGATAIATTRIERLKIDNLDNTTERSDSVKALDNKSLVALVSNAFEPTTGVEKAKPLLGLAKYADRLGISRLDIAFAPASKVTNSTSHGGFDNDPATLNDILGQDVRMAVGRGQERQPGRLAQCRDEIGVRFHGPRLPQDLRVGHHSQELVGDRPREEPGAVTTSALLDQGAAAGVLGDALVRRRHQHVGVDDTHQRPSIAR